MVEKKVLMVGSGDNGVQVLLVYYAKCDDMDFFA